ncbi:hypothetical protein [Vibrio mediterranei]|uniref:hypothetical protein n=1 Tax=Vibrio mediterranei TaxID=689 RepID=UPI00148E3D00|nr:hypothetical protein [Vibrio mediterranei]NOI24013.1 hypothetical protein [Vibrio mediterranei]
MKVNFVDPVGGMGHAKYNIGFITNYIEANNIKCQTDFIFQSNEEMNSAISDSYGEFEYRTLSKTKKGFNGRVQSMLNHIKPFFYAKIRGEKVVFLSFDTLSLFILFFLGFRPNLAVCHNNLNKIHGSKLLEYIYIIATRYVHVVYLTRSGIDYASQLGLVNNSYIPLPFRGFEYTVDEVKRCEKYIDFKRNHNIPQSSRIVFWAASGNSDNEFLQEILIDVNFNKQLDVNNCYFVYKGEELNTISCRTISLTGYVEDELWEGLMSHSQLSIVRYSTDFIHRASSICHSHVVNNKLAYISPLSLAKDYDFYFDGNITFDSTESFYNLLESFFDGDTPNLKVDLLEDSIKGEVKFYRELF